MDMSILKRFLHLQILPSQLLHIQVHINSHILQVVLLLLTLTNLKVLRE